MQYSACTSQLRLAGDAGVRVRLSEQSRQKRVYTSGVCAHCLCLFLFIQAAPGGLSLTRIVALDSLKLGPTYLDGLMALATASHSRGTAYCIKAG